MSNDSASSILEALECSKGGCVCHASARRGRGNTHCPAHEDRDPSLTITQRGTLLYNCKGGCTQEAVAQALKERGLLHEVRNADGQRVAWHERKGRWIRPDWTVGLGHEVALSDLLYGLQDLRERPNHPVVIVEGEKARDALAANGRLALGTFGATTDPTAKVLERLKGRVVYLWPDNDAPGKAQAKRLASTLLSLGIQVYQLDWPQAPEHGDAADFCQDKSSDEVGSALAPLVRAARQLKAPAGQGFRRLGLGYEAIYGEARFTLVNLRTNRDGDPEGELSVDVRLTGDDEWQPVASARLTVRSLSSRDAWLKALAKRHDLDWSRLISDFCTAVMRAEQRVDEPGMLLRDAVPPPAQSYLLAPLVLSTEQTVWFGDSGTGKSYMALAAALSIHAGVTMLGRQEPATQLRVAFLDFEFSGAVHKLRMKRLLSLRHDDPDDALPDLVYVNCKGASLGQQVERLQRIVRDRQVGFVVLDSIGMACDGPLGDDETARRFYRNMDQLGAPALCIAHITKGGDRDNPFGSVFFKHCCRLMWYMQRVRSDSGEVIKFINRKANEDGRIAPLTFRLGFGDFVEITAAASAEQAGLLPQVIELLEQAGEPLTYDDLRRALDPSPSQQTLSSLVSRSGDLVVLKERRNRKALITLAEAASRDVLELEGG